MIIFDILQSKLAYINSFGYLLLIYASPITDVIWDAESK